MYPYADTGIEDRKFWPHEKNAQVFPPPPPPPPLLNKVLRAGMESGMDSAIWGKHAKNVCALQTEQAPYAVSGDKVFNQI